MDAPASRPPVEEYPLPEVYEPEVCSVIEHIVRPGQLVVDAGASIGFFTRLLSWMVGPEGLVLAFEPDRRSFEYLERNTNGFDNVRAMKTALWSKTQPELKLWSVAQLGYTSICHYYESIGYEVVGARTLDSLEGYFGPKKPSFIKIDCEMAEFEILRGAERTLREGVDGVVLEFNYHLMRQNGVSDKEIRGFMADLDYDMFLININEGSGRLRPPVLVPPAAAIIIEGQVVHMNVLFSREALVRERWTT